MYHLTTSSTIPYQYITQLFQPFFSPPLHQAIPVYHLTTSSTIPYLYITQLFQSASFSSPLHQAIPVYHLTTSSTIPYMYITQSFQSALFLISTSPGHTSVSPYYQQYHSISVHHSVLPISPLSHLNFTRPYQCIILLPAVPFHICTSLSSSNQPSFSSPLHQGHTSVSPYYQQYHSIICTSLSPSNQPSFSSPHHQAIPVYHLTTSSTIPYLYITQSFQSALFLISTSPGHTSVSPYYQQYHSISVHHSVLPISPLSHLHFTRPYQCITLLPAVPFCICTSLSSFSPLSHLNFTRPYQCIILLPAVPFIICTSLSSSNQPSFSSPLHQAIPVYHLTTSSTILYLYITQLFQSALFLISTSPGHTSVSPYYQQYHSVSVHHSDLPISPLSHLHFTRPYQCITLLPAVPFCICTSLSSSNQPSFSSPLHQAIPVYHLLPAVPFHICTSLSPSNQPSFSSPHHQAIPVYHLTTSSTILYLYITQLF